MTSEVLCDHLLSDSEASVLNGVIVYVIDLLEGKETVSMFD